VTHSTTSAGARRPVWLWALCGLWFVACLNPMPDDFPSQQGADGVVPNDMLEPSPTGESEAPPALDGNLSDPGGVGNGSGGSADSASGAGGTGGTGGGGAPDAGVPEADAGP
jgi:hypothetical protein